MGKKVFNFNEFDQLIYEQDNSSAGKDAAKVAKSLFNSALKELELEPGEDFSDIVETDETKKFLPYKGCGSSPYTFLPVQKTNQEIISMFSEGGMLGNDIRYVDLKKEIESKSNKLFLLGIRETIDIKKSQGDKFVDKIAIIDPSNPSSKVFSYPITTCPSLAYYSDKEKAPNTEGIAIMQPDVVRYKIGIHKANTPSAHEALIQDGKMEIERFKIGDKKTIDTYRPDSSTKVEKEGLGINIHRGSIDNGVCVGPYSVGCQVFQNGKDFTEFMNKIKSSKNNNGTYLYALVENDELGSLEQPKFSKTTNKKTTEADDEKS